MSQPSAPPLSPTPKTPPRPADAPQPVAAVLAFLIPGAGHYSLGHTRRGILIALAIFGLFFGGLLIGGIDAVDSRENRIWFFGQALVGPTAFAVDAFHQRLLKVDGPAYFKDIEARSTFPGVNDDPSDFYTTHYERTLGFFRRAAAPYEIRDPNTGRAIVVRDPRFAADDPAAPLLFTDPRTGQQRLSTLDDRPPYVQSLGRASELGTLFATIAGMMNLICIIDAAYNHRKSK